MIRTIRRLIATDGGDNKEWVELTMLSSDAKPTSGIINGSIATEVDTGKVFFFDETAGEWVEQFSFQNAGGGSSLPAVTSEDNGDVLTVVDGAWGKGDAPYTVEQSMETVLAEHTINTTSVQGMNLAQLPSAFNDLSVGTLYRVTYNGTSYNVTAQESDNNDKYLGELSGSNPDFTNYPFFIAIFQNKGAMYATSANPTLKIEIGTKTVVPSDDFRLAVLACLPDDGVGTVDG